MRFLNKSKESMGHEPGPPAIRMVAIIPLVLSFFAFLLAMLLMVSGTSPKTLPGLALLTLNTSEVGDSILQELDAEIRAIHLTPPPLPTASIEPSAKTALTVRSTDDVTASPEGSRESLQVRGLVGTLLGNIGEHVNSALGAATNATASAMGTMGNTLDGILAKAQSGVSAAVHKIYSALFTKIRSAIGDAVKPLERAVAKALLKYAASQAQDLEAELGNLTQAAVAELKPVLQNVTHAAELALLKAIGQLIQNAEQNIVAALANETKQAAKAVAANAREELDAVKGNLMSFARNETADLGAAVASRLATGLSNAKHEIVTTLKNKTADAASAASHKASEALGDAQTDAVMFAHNMTKKAESAIISKASTSLAAARQNILASLSSAAGNASHSIGAAAAAAVHNVTTHAADAVSREGVSVMHVARSYLRNKTLVLESSIETSALHALTGLQTKIIPTVNRAFNGVAKDIQLADFYSFHTLGHCSGIYTDDNTASGSKKVLQCSKYPDLSPLSNLKQAIISSMISSGMAVATAAYAVFKTPTLSSARGNAFSAGAAAVNIFTVAAIIGSTSSSISKVINVYGGPLSVNSTAGMGYMVLLWTAAVLMGLSTVVWYVIYIWCERQNNQKLKSALRAGPAVLHISAPVGVDQKAWAPDQHWGER